MGLYNRLKIIATCENCHKGFDGKIQFKVGDLGLDEYNVGDHVKAELGNQKLREKKIVAYGILENAVCPFCGFVNNDEYDILISDLNIIKYDKMTDYTRYMETDGGEFYVIHE